MPANAQMLTPGEAAILAGADLRDIHRAFDERILPPSLLSDGPSRRIARGAVPLLAFYFATAGVLEARGRRAVIERIVGRGRTGALRRVEALRRHRAPIPLGEGVVVDLAPFVRRAEERARLLARARDAVVTDPAILGGSEPVLRGTRVPVHDVAAALRRGTTREAILRDYPSLTPDMLDLAALYAEAEPPRGPPRRDRRPESVPGARTVRRGAVPRRPPSEGTPVT